MRLEFPMKWDAVEIERQGLSNPMGGMHLLSMPSLL